MLEESCCLANLSFCLSVGLFNGWIVEKRLIGSGCSSSSTHIQTSILRPDGLCVGFPRWAGTRTNLDVTEWQWHQLGHMQICTLHPCPRQITTPASHHSVFYRLDARPAIQPTASKHWRHTSSSSTAANVLQYVGLIWGSTNHFNTKNLTNYK